MNQFEKNLRALEKKLRHGKIKSEDIEKTKNRIKILENIIKHLDNKKLETFEKKEKNMRIRNITSDDMLDQDYETNKDINAENKKKEKQEIMNRKKMLKELTRIRFIQIVKDKYNLKKKNFIKNHKLFTILNELYNQSSSSISVK
jgi:hypothetical protein